MKHNKEKLLASALVLGVLGAIGGFGVFAAFSATTENSANTITAGIVRLADNDSGSALYEVATAKPGEVVDKCIKVTYNGNIDAGISLYTTSTLDTLAEHLTLKVTPGTLPATATYPDCTGFTASGTTFSQRLDQFAAAHKTFDTGVVFNPGTATKWAPGDSLIYRVQIDLADTDAAQSLTTGAHELKWEARNK